MVQCYANTYDPQIFCPILTSSLCSQVGLLPVLLTHAGKLVIVELLQCKIDLTYYLTLPHDGLHLLYLKPLFLLHPGVHY